MQSRKAIQVNARLKRNFEFIHTRRCVFFNRKLLYLKILGLIFISSFFGLIRLLIFYYIVSIIYIYIYMFNVEIVYVAYINVWYIHNLCIKHRALFCLLIAVFKFMSMYLISCLSPIRYLIVF